MADTEFSNDIFERRSHPEPPENPNLQDFKSIWGGQFFEGNYFGGHLFLAKLHLENFRGHLFLAKSPEFWEGAFIIGGVSISNSLVPVYYPERGVAVDSEFARFPLTLVDRSIFCQKYRKDIVWDHTFSLSKILKSYLKSEIHRF